jgi:uncharacterized protein YqhQ
MADKFFYGGQAVIEGVMMRGRKSSVTAVRRPGGEVVTEINPLNPVYTGRLRKIPFVRGVVALIESMVLGIKTLVFSANVALSEKGEEAVQLSGPSLWLLLGISLAISGGLFFLVPLLFTNLFSMLKELSALAFNLIEGTIRLAIFIGYILLISLMPDIRRLFAYHGAEHKTINAFEAGAPLEVESVRKYGTAHIRCGTSFLFAVMVIAILVFSVVGRPALFFMVLARLGLIPVIAGISYELTFFGARHCHNPIVRAILTPGLLLQKLTTREPDDSQLEVAIAALKEAIRIDAPIAVTEVPVTAPATLIPNAVNTKEI